MELRKLRADEVSFNLVVHEEHLPVEGNVLASGDDAVDLRAERAVQADLRRGNLWAWCCVEMKASWCGFEESDFLGGCSYRDEEDFRRDGYYEDMKDCALEALNERLQSCARALSPLLQG